MGSAKVLTRDPCLFVSPEILAYFIHIHVYIEHCQTCWHDQEDVLQKAQRVSVAGAGACRLRARSRRQRAGSCCILYPTSKGVPIGSACIPLLSLGG